MNEANKRTTLIGLIILSLLPALALPVMPKIITLSSGLLYLSAISGYIGVVLLLWMYVLGAKSIFGLWFRDVAPVMRIHRWLGQYGMLFLLAHPLFITFSYGESLFYSIVPHISTEFERHVTLGRISLYLIAMLWISSILLRKKMGYRPWKYLHFLAYIALPFSLLHVPGTGSQFASEAIVKTYYFSLVVAYFVITLMRLRGLFASDVNTAEVLRHEIIAEGTYLLELELPPSSDMPEPGQYVYIRMGIISEDHPFSVAHIDEKNRRIMLGYRSTGRYSQAMTNLQNGDSVYISNPYGAFLGSLQDSKLPVVFIAGGIGVTPFVQALLAERSPENTWLFYANRSRSTTAFAKPLKQQLGAHCVALFSNEAQLQPGEYSGFISKEILSESLKNPQGYTYYICGPGVMMNHAKGLLTELGVPKTQIHTEAFEF